MKKRKFIGLGRKRRPEKTENEKFELPDNFILGFTNQHNDNLRKKPKKKVNSEE